MMKSLTNNSAGGAFQGKKRSLHIKLGGVHVQNLSGKYFEMLNRPDLHTCACGDKFPNPRNMRYHVRSCESMMCCDRRFHNTAVLLSHIIEAHSDNLHRGVKIAHPSCKFCGKSDVRSVLGRDKHVRQCIKNNLDSAQCSALYKTTPLPPNRGNSQGNTHMGKTTKDYFTNNDVKSPQSDQYPSLPKLKLPFAADYKKWKALDSKLKVSLLKRFPLNQRKTLTLDDLGREFVKIHPHVP